MKHFSTVILVLTCLWANSQELSDSPAGRSDKTVLTAKLGIPFGTIAKVEAEIFYGGKIPQKQYEDVYLLKIKSVNGKIFNKTLLLRFEDETGTLANDESSLYKLFYKNEADSLTETQIIQMNKKYVGKKLTLMAYETGHFRGMPHNYLNYRPIADLFFCFEHYLVIVSNLKK